MHPPRDDVIVQSSCGKNQTAACFAKGDGSLFTQCFVTDLFKEIVDSSWRCKEFTWGIVNCKTKHNG